MVAQLVLGVIASMIVSWYSRRREFRADRGGADLAGTPNMIGALQRLKRSEGEPMPPQMEAFGINRGEHHRVDALAHEPSAARQRSASQHLKTRVGQ